MSTAVTRNMRADAQRNRDALLLAAESAFGERGTAASLEEIAQLAGVGIGTLYRHFPTRHALVEALVHDRALELTRFGEGLFDADDPFAALEMWLTASIRHALAYRGLAESLIEASCTSDGPLSTACVQQEAIVSTLLQQAQDEGLVRPEVTTDDVIDLASSIAWVTERRGRKSFLQLLAIALEGIRKE